MYRWKLSSLSHDSLFQIALYLSAELKRIVDPIIERNSCFAHLENLPVAMATDERPHIRPLALRRVLAARSSQNETDTTPIEFSRCRCLTSKHKITQN